MNRVVSGVVLVLSVACLVSCTPSAPEPTLAPTASTTPEPTPTPTPTPTSEVQDLSDPDLGIVFEQVPDLTGDAAAVYNTLATYEVEYWRMMTTNQVSPAFSVLASAEIQARIQQIAATNAAIEGGTIGGVFRAQVGEVTVDGDTATSTLCDDYRDVTFADPQGTYTPEQAGFGEPRLAKLTLTRIAAESRWLIQTSETLGTC